MFQLLVVFQFELLFTVGEDSKIVWRFRLKKTHLKHQKQQGKESKQQERDQKIRGSKTERIVPETKNYTAGNSIALPETIHFRPNFCNMAFKQHSANPKGLC